MSEFPNTEDKDNWSVFLFDCLNEKVERVIVMLFKKAKEIIPNGLPNYTMRWWNEKSIKISFRVLRDKNSGEVVRNLEKSIEELLEKEHAENIIINPEGRDAKISGWGGAPLRKCKMYNQLSEFVVKLAEYKLFSSDNRNEMRHLAINMLFMREATVEPFAYFCDLISGKIIRQPYPLLIPIKKEK